MAGFFGLFNYEKEGPGIEKNAPKKRAPIVFFEIYGRKFWQLFYANLLFLLTNILVVTRGLADVGLCKITRNFAREKHAFVREDFFETIKKNWRQALPIGIINLVVIALLIFKEKISPRLWIAIVLITAASILLSLSDITSFSVSFYLLLALLACCCWGLENNCTRKLSNRDPAG